MATNRSAAGPEQLMATFSERAAAGDATGLIELYEPDGVFEPQPGVVLHSTAEIMPALTELASMRPRIDFAWEPDVVIVDEIAIVSNSWTLTAELPDGTPHREGGVSADILHRQPDGTWLVVID